MEFKHISVLLNECIEGLNIKDNGIYVDATLGGAGHSYEIASKLSSEGLLIGIDQDENAINAATKKLDKYLDRVRIVRSNFENMQEVLVNEGIWQVDGILMDLGVSSHQLDEGDRGFTYHGHHKLDMRMDTRKKISAYDVVNTYEESELIRIIKDYGEEKFAKRIAYQIIKHRGEKPIVYNDQLVEIIKKAVPKERHIKKHPAKKTFQAIRIEVNQELKVLENAVKTGIEMLAPGGRIAIITFHSLEDRMVKQMFKYYELSCICPKESPICICDKKKEIKIITRKPIIASEEEQKNNLRSRTAKLRIAEKI
jgi:16S rRNA (cytosine1402-N4)-methyltransferase